MSEKSRGELEKEWAEIAKDLNLEDFHRLDECCCGGKYICETRKLTEKEIEEIGDEKARFASSWFCPECDDCDYRYYDEDMNELGNQFN